MKKRLILSCYLSLVACARSTNDSDALKNSGDASAPCYAQRSAHQRAEQNTAKYRVVNDAANAEYSADVTKKNDAAKELKDAGLAKMMHQNTGTKGGLNYEQRLIDLMTGYSESQDNLAKASRKVSISANRVKKTQEDYENAKTLQMTAWGALSDCLIKDNAKKFMEEEAKKNQSNAGTVTASSIPKKIQPPASNPASPAQIPLPDEPHTTDTAKVQPVCVSNEDSYRYTHEVSEKGVVLRNTAAAEDNNITKEFAVVPCLRVALVCQEGQFLRNNGFIKLSFAYDAEGKRSPFIGKYIYAGQLSLSPNPECLESE